MYGKKVIIVHVRVKLIANVHVHIHAHIHANIHTRVHTHSYTRTQASMLHVNVFPFCAASHYDCALHVDNDMSRTHTHRLPNPSSKSTRWTANITKLTSRDSAFSSAYLLHQQSSSPPCSIPPWQPSSTPTYTASCSSLMATNHASSYR